MERPVTSTKMMTIATSSWLSMEHSPTPSHVGPSLFILICVALCDAMRHFKILGLITNVQIVRNWTSQPSYIHKLQYINYRVHCIQPTRSTHSFISLFLSLKRCKSFLNLCGTNPWNKVPKDVCQFTDSNLSPVKCELSLTCPLSWRASLQNESQTFQTILSCTQSWATTQSLLP